MPDLHPSVLSQNSGSPAPGTSGNGSSSRLSSSATTTTSGGAKKTSPSRYFVFIGRANEIGRFLLIVLKWVVVRRVDGGWLHRRLRWLHGWLRWLHGWLRWLHGWLRWLHGWLRWGSTGGSGGSTGGSGGSTGGSGGSTGGSGGSTGGSGGSTGGWTMDPPPPPPQADTLPTNSPASRSTTNERSGRYPFLKSRYSRAEHLRSRQRAVLGRAPKEG